MNNSKILKGTIEASTDNSSAPSDAKPSKKQAFFLMRLIQEPVVPQDVYSIAEVSKLLGMSRDQVCYLSTIRGNPLPIRKFPDVVGESFVLRDELVEWLRNCPLEYQRKSPSLRRLFRQFVRILACLIRMFFHIGQICESVMTRFNTKYDRIGHLFQERFKSEPVEDDEYFLTVLRYIHNNPVKAGIRERAEDYPLSSGGDKGTGLMSSRKQYHSVAFMTAPFPCPPISLFA